jgi:hypothetical protein
MSWIFVYESRVPYELLQGTFCMNMLDSSMMHFCMVLLKIDLCTL